MFLIFSIIKVVLPATVMAMVMSAKVSVTTKQDSVSVQETHMVSIVNIVSMVTMETQGIYSTFFCLVAFNL